MGVSWAEAARMPWGVCRFMFEARAEAWDSAHNEKNNEDVRIATLDDVDSWI